MFTIRTGSSVTIVPTSEHCFSVVTTEKPAGHDPLGDKATSRRAIEMAGAKGSAKKGISKSTREKREQQRDVPNAYAETAAKLRSSRRSIAGAGRISAAGADGLDNSMSFLWFWASPPRKQNQKSFWKSFGKMMRILFSARKFRRRKL